MINLDLPLEVNRHKSDYPNIRNPIREGDNITVQYAPGRLARTQFNALTGIMVGQEEIDNPVRLRNVSEEQAVTMFRVWFGHQDWGKDDWRYLQDDSLYQFDNGKAAAERAKALNKEAAEAGAPWKFMVKSHVVMSPNHRWREWMQERFDSGEYTAVPWQDEPWYNKDHFAHAALSDGFKVAFVESALAGADDKMSVINPGRYLERFYSEHLNAQEIAAWAAKADSEAELAFLMSPDEIEASYTSGQLETCMRYAADSPNFPLGVQPTRIYGAGDLALATLTRRGKLVARALVWPERKTVGRIYGDKDRLLNRLVAEGYTFKEADRSVFEGARMLRIDMGGELVMPYLDWEMGADDDGTHLIIRGDGRNARYRGQTTNGTATGRAIQICGHEGCRTVLGDDVPHFYNSSTGRNICVSCADRTLVRCVATNDLFATTGRNAQVMHQVMSRDGTTPFPGFRGGHVSQQAVQNGYTRNTYRMVGGVLYPVTETRIRPGTVRTYEPIPADA